MPSQTEGKLIVGWLQELGLDIEFSVLDAGALSARVWTVLVQREVDLQ